MDHYIGQFDQMVSACGWALIIAGAGTLLLTLKARTNVRKGRFIGFSVAIMGLGVWILKTAP